MVCLGVEQAAPRPLESEAAQLRAVELFRADFLARFPDGVVISELEYMGRTTSAPNQPGPLQFSGRPRVNKILSALTQDFRRWSKDRDYRKCDALGISRDGTSAELLEVTTAGNVQSATVQLVSKLAILRETVNRIHDLSVDWRASFWRPNGAQLFYSLPPISPDEFRFLCYVPTSRLTAAPGVILYELHSVKRPTVPVTLPIPKEAVDDLRRGYQSPQRQANEEAWAHQFVAEHPVIGALLRALALVLGVALVVVALILIFDPVPGDEAAAGAAAMWLLNVAMQ